MKILIIEDEILLADSLRAMLEGKGFSVEAVHDGETGAEYAETGVYDLLILDVMMPGMDGYQVARQVRAKRCGTPILMLTAKSSLEDRIEGLNAGADYYLTKPFDARELLACVGALLRRFHTLQQDASAHGPERFHHRAQQKRSPAAIRRGFQKASVHLHILQRQRHHAGEIGISGAEIVQIKFYAPGGQSLHHGAHTPDISGQHAPR